MSCLMSLLSLLVFMYAILPLSLVTAGTVIFEQTPKESFITVAGHTKYHSENGQLIKDSYKIKTNLAFYDSNKMMVVDQKHVHQYSVKVNEGWKDLGQVSETKSASQLGMVDKFSSSHQEVPLEVGETLILNAKEDAGGRIVVDAKIESTSILQFMFSSFSRLEWEVRYPLICLIALSAVALLLIGSMVDDVTNLFRNESNSFLLKLNKKKDYQLLKHSEI